MRRPIISSLTAILVSRFLLNLQDVYQARRVFNGTSPAVSTILEDPHSVRFAAVLGSVGTHLTTGNSADELRLEMDSGCELQRSHGEVEVKSPRGEA